MRTLSRLFTMDPAVAKALNLSASSCKVSSHGGSGFSSTNKITAHLPDGSTKLFFLKIGKGSSAATMFRGEHASLNAIHHAVPSLCPASFGHGTLYKDPHSHFLVTDFLDLSGRGAASAGGMSLARKLAKLHTTPAPVPEGYEKPVFGFPVTTCCGDTPQENGFRESWAEFYADNRLRAMAKSIERNHGGDKELQDMIEKTASRVVPRLLGDDHLNGGKCVTPVVVHGDLWSGNASAGRIGSQGDVEEVVFDPSACYAHSEFELGIMSMFGGFGGSMKEYHEHCPKTEPVDEYPDRIKLYELYHQLNHTSIFGGSYRSGAMSIMRNLVKKYGEG